MAQECSEFSDFNNAPGFNGLSVSFAQFVAPFSERSTTLTALALVTPPLLLTRRCPTVNFNKFGFDMTYVTKVMGYGKQTPPPRALPGPLLLSRL